MRLLQRDLHQQLRVEAIATRERIAAMVRPLDPAKINEHPEPKGWSVGQVLEHLCLADELYDGPFGGCWGARARMRAHRRGSGSHHSLAAASPPRCSIPSR